MSDFLKRIADFSPKRLLLLAAELEEQVRALESSNHAPVAIVGIGCRYPGGIRNPETFWQLLSEGRDAITEVPAWRWNTDDLFDPDPHAVGKIASRWGGFIDSPDLFDAGFFGIAPIEAAAMDPQQRLLLEVSWEALEHAAVDPSQLDGSRTGVFVGLCNSDYAQRALELYGNNLDAYFAQGASHAVASGRISYFLGLRGPSVAMDTACSSSLVAIHQACQSLRSQEIDMALAGGVNLLFNPQVTIALSRAQMMAPDGRCKAFSAEANGFVRSEGCGVVVLKRLADAVRDQDRVLAVIRGTAVNQDGRSSGITAPNGPSQEEVIRTALEDGKIDANAVGYVEAHGTGTNLGDPIELQALQAVLGQDRSNETRLLVGSVKSNFGHAEAAAGVGGLIKLALSLQHAKIPASLHFKDPNPSIDWAGNRLRIPTAMEQWIPSHGYPSLVGAVSSFGFSGTNAHIIVEEAPKLPGSPSSTQSPFNDCIRTVTLSARSQLALGSIAGELADQLRQQPELPLADVAHSLAVGRSTFAHRAAIRADSSAHLVEELTLLARDDSRQETDFARGVVESRAHRVAFLFAGQGGEHTGMGLSLLENFEVFRNAVAAVDAALVDILSIPVETIFRNANHELSHSALVQPALFAFQFGLARLWQSWGVEPAIVVGHSMGQIVATTIAGVLTVEDAARLVAARGRLTEELGDPGGMVAVAAPEDQVLQALTPYAEHVSIAAINGPSSVVISGRSQPLELVTQSFERAGIRVKRLNITYGSHSPAMRRVLAPFHQEAAKAQYNAPNIPILADMTGELVEGSGTFNARYFTSHLARPVQFHRCLERLAKEDCSLAIEMGPRAVITLYGRDRGQANTRWVASATGRESDFDALQTALGEAFTAGAPIRWKNVFQPKKYRKLALPTYPFERERYWIDEDDRTSSTHRSASSQRSMNLREAAQSALPGQQLDTAQPIFQAELSSPLPLHLDQHQVEQRVVLPASFFLWQAVCAIESVTDSLAPAFELRGLAISRPLLPGHETLLLQTSVATSSSTPDITTIQISSRKTSDRVWHSHASVECNAASKTADAPQPSTFDRSRAASIDGASFYDRLEAAQIQLGPAFQGIQELWYLPNTALARIAPGKEWHKQKGGSLAPHPALLDACFQVLGGASLADTDSRLRLVTAIEQISIFHPFPGELFVEAQLTPGSDDGLIGRLIIRDAQGLLLMQMSGIQLSIAAAAFEHNSKSDWLYEQSWEKREVLSCNQKQNQGKHWILLGSPTGTAGLVAGKLRTSGETAEVMSWPPAPPTGTSPMIDCDWVDLRCIEDPPSFAAENSGIAQEAASNAMRALDLWQQALKGQAGLWMFTRGAQPARPAQPASDVSGLAQSTLWGLARCATLEHPNRLRRIVDLDPSLDNDQLIAIIHQELLSSDDEEQVAYAGVDRMAFRLKRSSSKHPTQETLKPFRKDASYLLTGGVGGLGLRVAAWLAHQNAGTLVLTTRSLTSIASRQSELDGLRALGIDLHVVQADVGDQASMQALFSRFADGGNLPPLRGIFHMAAQVDGHALDQISERHLQAAFEAKVNGTWVLHELTRHMALDFFVGFSSTAAVIGSSHLADYAAANSFMDAIAAWRMSEGLPFTAIAWGTWQTMRLANNQAQQRYSSSGMLPMNDEQALDWLGLLIQQQSFTNSVVANIDWTLLAPLYESRRVRRWLDYLRPETNSLVPTPSPSWSIEPGETRLAALERTVLKVAARVLGLRRGQLPAREVRLSDLGLDSLMAVNLRNRLQALVGHALPSTFAFEHPTPAKMALALDLLLWSAGIEEDLSSESERDEIKI